MLYNIFSKCKVNKFFFMTKCFAVKISTRCPLPAPGYTYNMIWAVCPSRHAAHIAL